MKDSIMVGKEKRVTDILSRCLPVAVIMLTVARIIIGLRIPYWILTDQFYDDRMMYENTINIANGIWLGPYDAYTLTKGIGYSLFMVLAKKLCIPYSLLLAMLNVVGAFLLTAAVSEFVKNKYARVAIYGLLLFSPINLTMLVTQRLYRMAIIPCMVEIVFAAMIGLTLRKRCPIKKQLIWSILAGLSLAFFWQIREDSIWILPFVVVITVINVVSLTFFFKEKGKMSRIVLAVLPVMLLLAGNLGVAMVNRQQYDVFVINDRTGGSYGEMMSLLYKIDGEGITNDIWISKDVIYQAEEASATLGMVKTELDDFMERWAGGEEIKGDHYSWVIRGAVQDAGYATDAFSAEKFYAQVVEELNEAIDSGELVLRDDSAIYFSSQARGVRPEEIPGFLGDALANIWEISGYAECALDGNAKSTGLPQDIRQIEAFTSVFGIYKDSYCFSAEGQIVAKDVGTELSCVLRRGGGQQLYGIILNESEFSVEVTDEYEVLYQLDVYLDGKYYTTLNFENFEDDKILCNIIDTRSERLFDHNAEYSSGMVSLVNRLNGLYQLAGKPCFVLAMICFVLLTIYVIRGIIKRKYSYLELWFLLTGVLLSAVLLRFGNSIFTSWFTEDMQRFINSFYSSGVYMLIQIFKYLSIAVFIHAVVEIKNSRRIEKLHWKTKALDGGKYGI